MHCIPIKYIRSERERERDENQELVVDGEEEVEDDQKVMCIRCTQTSHIWINELRYFAIIKKTLPIN